MRPHKKHLHHHEKHAHNIPHGGHGLTPEQVRREAEEISQTIWAEDVLSKRPKRRSPLWIILGPVIALMIVLMVVPYYAVRLDPEPKNIPSLEEVLPEGVSIDRVNSTNIISFLDPNNPTIKQIATKVAAKSCPNNKNCQAKAIYYFVRDNIVYVNDPPHEYYEMPLETLETGGADCDGMAILLASMMESIGISTRFVFVPKHVYVQIYLNDAPKKYKQKDGWISLDSTCKNCEFSKVTYGVSQSEKRYVGGY